MFLQRAELDGLLQSQQFLFQVVEFHIDGNNLTVLEVVSCGRIGNILLEPSDIVFLHILLRIVAITWDDGRLQHPHQVGERVGIAVMRSGRSENHAITMLRQELRQVTALAGVVGHRVAFVDDHNIPSRLLQPRSELCIILQRINGNDGLVVVVKRILVERYL